MFDKYRIKDNETLGDVAKKFNTSLDYIMDLNNAYYSDGYRAGMDIVVPKNSQGYFETYTINKGDSLYAIGKKYNVNPTLLASLNGLNMDDYIYPGQQLLLPVNNYSYYITKEGDTLKTVSDLFGVSPSGMLVNNDNIYLLPGQVLVNKK